MPKANNAENNNKQQPTFRSSTPKVRASGFYATSKKTDDRQQPGFGERETTQS